MLKKTLALTMGIVIGALTALLTVMPSTNLVLAATIQCNSPPVQCDGTEGDDTMYGDDNNNLILGRGGNDVISGKDGSKINNLDVLGGGFGNDVISGGKGHDEIFGSQGADKINGGPGDDKITHAFFTAPGTDPDGSSDVIDCGSGNDEVFINVSVDHDIQTNCETVHAG